MTVAQPVTAPAPVQPSTVPVVTPPTEPAQVTPVVDTTDWKAEARKWEDRAKTNKDAADKLAAIEEANKTEAQKHADRAAAAELRATEADARALRLDVALEHKLTKEDAALLATITDETAMRALAARLATQAAASAPTVGAVVPGLGTTPVTPGIDAQIAEAEAKGDWQAAISLKRQRRAEQNK